MKQLGLWWVNALIRIKGEQRANMLFNMRLCFQGVAI